MAATYTPIASITLSANTPSVTFSSIPQTYTDLVLVLSLVSSSTASYTNLRINSDSGSNYSRTYLLGTGSSAISGRDSNVTQIAGLDTTATGSTFGGPHILNFQNYSNTTTNKTYIWRENIAGSQIVLGAGLYRSTSAITSITLASNANSYGVGSTFNLYGILGANA